MAQSNYHHTWRVILGIIQLRSSSPFPRHGAGRRFHREIEAWWFECIWKFFFFRKKWIKFSYCSVMYQFVNNSKHKHWVFTWLCSHFQRNYNEKLLNIQHAELAWYSSVYNPGSVVYCQSTARDNNFTKCKLLSSNSIPAWMASISHSDCSSVTFY